MKEARFPNPSKEHPMTVPMTIAIDGLQMVICRVSCHLEWEDGTYGTKIPIVVLRVVPPEG